MKAMHYILGVILFGGLQPLASGQVNSGSNGSDGAFNPTSSITINMADHPTGVYNFTSVNIPGGVVVRFTPNPNNTPVVWLVQGDCIINGEVNVTGNGPSLAIGGSGGPGGFRGGNAAPAVSAGEGPGGGQPGAAGGNGSYATYAIGFTSTNGGQPSQPSTLTVYGNNYLLPLIGGSGGAGSDGSYDGRKDGGGGGGGALLIASSGTIRHFGTIAAYGPDAGTNSVTSGCGSGGSVRLIATTITGTGRIVANGGLTSGTHKTAGDGRVRLDCVDDQFTGTITGQSSRGFQPIILPAGSQASQLTVISISGTTVPAPPGGVIARPDITVLAQQNNPVNIVVGCSNVMLGTTIEVTIHPKIGADISASGVNNIGTDASSTAIIPINMPRGGGTVYASAATGVVATSALAPSN